MPRIEPEALVEILDECDISEPRLHIRTMILHNFVNLSNDYYSIAGPIRFAFRQIHGFGDPSIHSRIAAYFTRRLQDSDDVDNELIDRAIFVISPRERLHTEEFKSIISATTVLKIVSELYRRGKYDKDGKDLERAITLARWLPESGAEERVLREIAGVKTRSLIRLRRFPEADREILKLEALSGSQRIRITWPVSQETQ